MKRILPLAIAIASTAIADVTVDTTYKTKSVLTAHTASEEPVVANTITISKENTALGVWTDTIVSNGYTREVNLWLSHTTKDITFSVMGMQFGSNSAVELGAITQGTIQDINWSARFAYCPTVQGGAIDTKLAKSIPITDTVSLNGSIGAIFHYNYFDTVKGLAATQQSIGITKKTSIGKITATLHAQQSTPLQNEIYFSIGVSNKW